GGIAAVPVVVTAVPVVIAVTIVAAMIVAAIAGGAGIAGTAAHVVDHVDLLGQQVVAVALDARLDAVAALQVVRPEGPALVAHHRAVVIGEGDLASPVG